METYAITLGAGEEARMPSFTVSHTLVTHRRKPEWASPAEAVADLAGLGVSVSKQTLFLRERAGRLHTRRLSPRKVLFDLNEVREEFGAGPA